MKSIRSGISGEEKENRELVFGNNMIDIKQKTVPQLLVDEVLYDPLVRKKSLLISLGIPSILCIPSCQSYSMVNGSVLLLRCVYFRHIRCEHYYYTSGD